MPSLIPLPLQDGQVTQTISAFPGRFLNELVIASPWLTRVDLRIFSRFELLEAVLAAAVNLAIADKTAARRFSSTDAAGPKGVPRSDEVLGVIVTFAELHRDTKALRRGFGPCDSAGRAFAKEAFMGQ